MVIASSNRSELFPGSTDVRELASQKGGMDDTAAAQLAAGSGIVSIYDCLRNTRAGGGRTAPRLIARRIVCPPRDMGQYSKNIGWHGLDARPIPQLWMMGLVFSSRCSSKPKTFDQLSEKTSHNGLV